MILRVLYNLYLSYLTIRSIHLRYIKAMPTVTVPPIVSDQLNKTDINQFFSSPIEVHLVDKDDIFYQKGRILAEDVYRQIWKTDHLIDGNDYAALVVCNNTVLGNMNLQTRNSRNLLKSEVFFQKKHWEDYLSVPAENIAELSGLSVSQELPVEYRQLVLMILILGASTISHSLEVDVWATVQRKALNRILAKRFRLSFISNTKVIRPQKEVPKDKYWNSSEMPQIHYLDLKKSQNINAFGLFYAYLHLQGINLKFLPRFRSLSMPFSTFYNNCCPQSKSA